MTILDVNILVYASDERAPEHQVTFAWLNDLFGQSERIGFSWPTIWGYIRITTDRRLGDRYRTPAEAFEQVRDWLIQPEVVAVKPGPRHLEILEFLVTQYQAHGPRVSDAVLAALAIEHGATLASTDRDFSRFPNLKWVNPLDEV